MNDMTNIIIDIFILIFTSICILTSIGILFLLFYYRHEYPFDTTTFLIINNYIPMIGCSLILLDEYSHNLYGNLYKNVSFDNWWCYIRGYLMNVLFSALYHSYIIQACFRLFRVVFHQYPKLQTLPFMFTLVLIQWLLDIILVLPILLLHYYEYTSQYYFCQILLTNIRGLLNAAIVGYYVPMIIIGSIYFYIIYYIKHQRNLITEQNRNQSNQRDIIVLIRIIILIGMLIMISFPALLICIWYFITGNLFSLVHHFQWLTFAFSLSILPTLTALLTPQLYLLLTLIFGYNTRIESVIEAKENIPIQINTRQQSLD